MDIDKIALEVAGNIWTDSVWNRDDIKKFTHALLAKLAEDAEPVGYQITWHDKDWNMQKVILSDSPCDENDGVARKVYLHPQPVTKGCVEIPAGWKPIETAPIGKRILVCVPLVNHRLVIAYKNDFGLFLDEQMQPMPYPPFWWMPLPAAPTPEGEESK